MTDSAAAGFARFLTANASSNRKLDRINPGHFMIVVSIPPDAAVAPGYAWEPFDRAQVNLH